MALSAIILSPLPERQTARGGVFCLAATVLHSDLATLPLAIPHAFILAALILLRV